MAFENFQPLDIGGAVARGMGAANQLVGMKRGMMENQLLADNMAEEQRSRALAARTRNFDRQGDQLEQLSPQMEELIAKQGRINMLTGGAEKIPPLLRSREAEQLASEHQKHSLLDDATERVKTQFQQEYAANPDMTPAEKHDAINRFWQPERYELDKALPNVPRDQMTKPSAPLFAGGRGLYKQDIPQTMDLDTLLKVKESNKSHLDVYQQLKDRHEAEGKELARFGSRVNIMPGGGEDAGRAYSFQGTPGQIQNEITKGGKGTQVMKEGEKPIGLVPGNPEWVGMQKDMRQEFERQEAPFKTITQDYGDLRDALQRDDRVGALTALTKYAKMHNPGIGLGEGQYLSAQQAVQFLPAPLANAFNRVMDGKDDTLLPETRKMLATGGHDLYSNALKGHTMTRGFFEGQGQRLRFPEGSVTGGIPLREEFAKPLDLAKSAKGDVYTPPPPTPKAQAGDLPKLTTTAAVRALKPGDRFIWTDGQEHVRD